MAAPGQQQQDQQDAAYTPLWIAVFISIAAFVAWYAAHDFIVGFMVKLKLYQVDVLRIFYPGLNKLHSQLSQLTPSGYPSINYDALFAILDEVGRVWCYPVAAILGLFALKLIFGSPVLKYKRQLSMQSLANQEVNDWPQITPVVHADLIAEHAEKGRWAMGLTPMQFAKKHHLLQEEKEVVDSNVLRAQTSLVVSLRRGAAYQVFATQLGPYWNGVERLPMHRQALFAVFASRIAGDRAGAGKVLEQIAASAKFDAKKQIMPPLNYAGTTELLKKHQNNKLVIKITRHHAFVMTVIASMLMTARNDGVLAAADFLWLKIVDRPLWFLLNSVGRKTPFVEAAGVYGHWLAELQLGQAIKLPVIDEAINGLDGALKEVVYTPDEVSE